MNTRLPSFAEVNPKPDMACIIHTDTLQVLQPAQKHSLHAQIQGTVTEIMEVLHLWSAYWCTFKSWLKFRLKTDTKPDKSPGGGQLWLELTSPGTDELMNTAIPPPTWERQRG